MLFSQQLPKESIRWLEENLKATNVDQNELTTDLVKYNFSSIWMSNQETNIGFIGDNYQRFYVHFQEVVKNDTMPAFYLVKGKSKASNNVCNFEGEILILHIREINKKEREEMLKAAKEHNDPDLINRAKYEQFIILAEYEFYENQNQKWSGIFKGILKSYFYVNNGSIFYDDLDRGYSDSFANNLFVGIWKGYKTDAVKSCNWGNFRIPFSGDLDIGAGFFSPNEKYLRNGWGNYYRAYITGDKDALKDEGGKWW